MRAAELSSCPPALEAHSAGPESSAGAELFAVFQRLSSAGPGSSAGAELLAVSQRLSSAGPGSSAGAGLFSVFQRLENSKRLSSLSSSAGAAAPGPSAESPQSSGAGEPSN